MPTIKVNVGDSDWISTHVPRYAKVCSDYAEFAKVVRAVLTEAAGTLAPGAFVQAREKSVSSFAEKILRKRKLYKDPLEDMTDLCGARVILHTRNDVNAFCQWIEKNFEIDQANSEDVSRRLQPTEFGYRSVHYIVQFKSGVFPTPPDAKFPIATHIDEKYYRKHPDTGAAMKAEIQVRTLLEHAYADISHDMTYKSAFSVPQEMSRQFAQIAAGLERADLAFDEIVQRISWYRSSHGPFLPENELRKELVISELVLQALRDNAATSVNDHADAALLVARLAVSLEDWKKAVDALRPVLKSGVQPVIKCMGMCLCKLHNEDPHSQEFEEGRLFLEQASDPSYADAEAMCLLAETYPSGSKERSNWYRLAFDLDFSHPLALCSHLVDTVFFSGLEDAWSLRPTIRQAIERCRAQIAARANPLQAYGCLCIFHLLLGQVRESLSALCKLIEPDRSSLYLRETLANLDRMQRQSDRIDGWECARRLALLGLAIKGKDTTAIRELKSLSRDIEKRKAFEPLKSPVIIVAGGCQPSVQALVTSYRSMLQDACDGFQGTIISGGTRDGVCGLVGDLRAQENIKFRAIGYLPGSGFSIPPDTDRYDEIRKTSGTGIIPMECAQAWIDILASDISPQDVYVLGINGGDISAIEFRVALALGAQVGVLAGSGGEATAICKDPAWQNSSNLIPLPDDGMSVRAFLYEARWADADHTSTTSGLTASQLETATEKVFEIYNGDVRSKQEAFIRNQLDLSRPQAMYAPLILKEFGYELVPLPTERKLADLSQDVEEMARREHGRWNAERLKSGWRYGEVKDEKAKIHPCLVSWEELPENSKEWDRIFVASWPDVFRKAGLAIVRRD